jgi:beta-phosphoglucomutase-like phosphatase (HAD superfamily)
MDFVVKRNWDAYNELAREPQEQLAYNLTPQQRLERCCELYAIAKEMRVETEQSRKADLQRRLQKYQRRRQLIPGLRKLESFPCESADQNNDR